MKLFLLNLLVLSFPGASQSCSDSSDFKWKSNQGEQLDCNFLTSSTDSQIKKQRLDNWCPRTVTGVGYLDKSEAAVKDKCQLACESCCESNCQDSTTFKWRYGSSEVGCNYLSTQTRIATFCYQMVQGIGGDYANKECRVQSKCPKTCNNCCS